MENNEEINVENLEAIQNSNDLFAELTDSSTTPEVPEEIETPEEDIIR